MVNAMLLPLSPMIETLTIEYEVGWAPGLDWAGEKILAPYQDDLPAHSQSLYHLSYRGPERINLYLKTP